MNNLYLIDTSVWIFALRKKFDPKIKSYVENLLDEDRIIINPIIKPIYAIMLLYRGPCKKGDERSLPDRIFLSQNSNYVISHHKFQYNIWISSEKSDSFLSG